MNPRCPICAVVMSPLTLHARPHDVASTMAAGFADNLWECLEGCRARPGVAIRLRAPVTTREFTEHGGRFLNNIRQDLPDPA